MYFLSFKIRISLSKSQDVYCKYMKYRINYFLQKGAKSLSSYVYVLPLPPDSGLGIALARPFVIGKVFLPTHKTSLAGSRHNVVVPKFTRY